MNRTFTLNNYSFTLPEKRTKTSTQVVSTITIYLVMLVLTYSDFVKAQLQLSSEINVEIKIGGLLGGHILAIPLLLTVAFLTDRDFRKLVFGRIGVLYAIVISVYLITGFLFENGFDYMKVDLTTALWLPAGCAMFYIISNSYRPKIQLFFVVLISTSVLLYSWMLLADRLGASETSRMIFSGIRYTWSLSLITSIAIAVFSRQGFLWATSIWALIAIHMYTIAASGTRSVTLTLITVIIFSVLILFYKLSQGILLNSSNNLKSKWLAPLIFLLGFCLFAFVFSDFLDANLTRLTNSSILQRFISQDGIKSSGERIADLFNLFKSFQDIDFIWGRGIGATYLSPDVAKGHVALNFQFWFTHFGVFTYWLKGGIILFGLVIFYFYFKLPKLFIKSLLKPNSFDPRERTALLIVLPGIFGYVVCMSTQAVFMDYQSFWGLGFLFGAYLHIKKYGLDIFFE